MSHISILRPNRRGEFDRSEVRLLRSLTPHLQRALQLHTRIVELRAEREAIAETLDRVPVGIVLLDRSGKTLLVNRAASEIFASKDGLTLKSEGLAAATNAETVALRRLISGAAATANRAGTESGGVMVVSRPSMRRPFSVFVTPLTARDSAFADVRPAVAVFLTDPERKLETDDGVLRCLYGFTPAEAHVAAKLMQGESAEEAAEELHVSLNTARTHIKRLFEKTDTHRHRELLRVLLSGVATIRAQ
jgi:DNA-binding CsgD family transcriptional regulator